MKKVRIFAIPLLIVLVMLVGMGVGACGGEATPGPPTPGGWVASIDIGDLSFIVSPDSTGISEVVLSITGEFKCGTHTVSDSLHGYKNPDLWLITDGRFIVEPLASTGYWVIDVQGEFDQDGTHASGTWAISSEGTICQEGTWEASPSS
jgi:hypothetical protein